MRFYYFSLFSWLAYILVVLVAIGLLSLVWKKVLGLKFRNSLYWILVAAILIAPWVEELEIAYNFDQLCRKDAGVFINKTVEVDGFYDDTSSGSLDLVRSGTYRFVESRATTGYTRLTSGDEALRQKAVRQFEGATGKDASKEDSIRVAIDDQTEVLLFPQKGDVWRVTKLDKPTARYEYKNVDRHAPVAHQIKRFEDIVLDRQTGEVLGRWTTYTRGPHWFFISLDVPTIECRELKGKDPIVYRSVLKPTSSK